MGPPTMQGAGLRGGQAGGSRGSCRFGRRCFVPSATKVDSVTTAVPSQYGVKNPQKDFRRSSRVCALGMGFAGATSAPGSPHLTSDPRCRFRHRRLGRHRRTAAPSLLVPLFSSFHILPKSKRGNSSPRFFAETGPERPCTQRPDLELGGACGLASG